MKTRLPILTAQVLCLAMPLVPLLAGPAHAASFDCAKAKAADEQRICADRTLNDLDVRMVALLDLDLSTVAMGQGGDIHDAQSAWLKTRSACHGDRNCLRAHYKARISTLRDHLVKRLCGANGPPC